MKVYVLTIGRYSDYGIVKIFNSKELLDHWLGFNINDLSDALDEHDKTKPVEFHGVFVRNPKYKEELKKWFDKGNEIVDSFKRKLNHPDKCCGYLGDLRIEEYDMITQVDYEVIEKIEKDL